VVKSGTLQNIPYRSVQELHCDFQRRCLPNVFVVHPACLEDLKDLVTLMKNDPKKFSIATPGIGTRRLVGTIAAAHGQADIATVPYGGAGPAVAAVVAPGSGGCTALPRPRLHHLRRCTHWRDRARRSQALPNVPTRRRPVSQGRKQIPLQGYWCRGTPKGVVDRIHAT